MGVANGLGDAKTTDDDADDADLGSHDLQATWTPMGGDADDDKLTSNTVSVIVAGEAKKGDIEISVETLRPGQVATIDVLFTDADGNIAPDGTPTSITAAGQSFAETGMSSVVGTTSNGRVSATLLPSGSDAVVTVLAQAGEDLRDDDARGHGHGHGAGHSEQRRGRSCGQRDRGHGRFHGADDG